MSELRIGWVGFHQEGVPALKALIKRGGVVGVATLNEEAAAKRSGAADVASICEAASIPVSGVNNINEPEALDVLRSWNADVIFVIGWSQILREEALLCARIGTFGTHASLLPRLRGSAPVNWAIIRGEQRSGNSLMWLSADVDDGDLAGQRAFELTPYDTCSTVYDKVAETNRELLLELLSRLEDERIPRKPQGPTSEPLLPRRRPEDGLIDWSQDASTIYRFIRALTRPYPGAFTDLQSTRYFIWDAMEFSGVPGAGVPGQVIGAIRSPTEPACGLVVACGSGLIGLREVEAEGGRLLTGRALAEQPWQGLTLGT